VAVWDKDRTEQLLWWRIPVEFLGTDYSTGKNFVPMRFET
jgi:hypothetical protein